MIDPAGPERDSAGATSPPRQRLSPNDRRPASDREGPAVHDHLARSTPTVRIAARDRWPVAIAGLLGLFLAGALLKPWVGPAVAPGPFDAAAGGATPSGSAPSVGPDLLAGLRTHCQDPLGWRVYSRELWLGRPVRTWRSVEPMTRATGPADPTIPVAPLGPYVEAIGFCSPWTGPERPPDDAVATAWTRTDDAGGLTVVPLRAIAPDDPTPLGALFGAVAGPGADGAAETSGPAATAGLGPSDGGALATPTGWPTGRYVFALRAVGWERWWAVQVAPADRGGPDAPAPGDGPAAPKGIPGEVPAGGSASP